MFQPFYVEKMIDTRLIALTIFQDIVRKKQNLDVAFDTHTKLLNQEDKAFIRMLVTTTLRHLGQCDAMISKMLQKKLPTKANSVMDILRLSVCQMIFMNTAEHAAVYTAGELTKKIDFVFYTKLVNGVLRNIQRQKENLTDIINDFSLNVPTWLLDKWKHQYGKEKTNQIIAGFMSEPDTFICAKKDSAVWAEKLNGKLLPTGSIRLPKGVYIPSLEGYDAGDWWVQDIGAALVVQLFDDLKGKKVADFCAAPGGKTLALSNAGANVDAFDISEKRTKRITENLKRLRLNANVFVSDANKIEGEKIYDAILLDAPCSATGTIRRHPDIYIHRTPEDIEKLSQAQKKLLHTAHRLLKDDGILVYCTCSLQKEEGEDMIESVSDLFERSPIKNENLKPYITKSGDVRTFPQDGMDGFFMTKLTKKVSS